MNRPVDWSSITAPLDVMNIYVPSSHLRRWLRCTQTATGLLFRCETADGQESDLRIDVVRPDVIRIRMSGREIRPGPSELLVEQGEAPPPFEVDEREDLVILTTDRVRLEFPRFPWQMRAFDIDTTTPSTPFFSQRIDDRAYGPAYEVPPVGFDEVAAGPPTVRETVAVAPGEALYGLGEKFTPVERWGQEHISWATDAGNVTSYRSYKNVPFLLSTAGYGLFVHTTAPIVYRMGSESSISYSFHIAEDQLDYFLIYGPEFRQILRRYAELTGFAPVPPKWSFGFWISRCGYKTRAEVEEVIREMRARDFPCDVVSIDPWWMGDGPWSTYEWDTTAFPAPEAMMRGLREQGVRTCLWIHPYVPKGTDLYDEGVAKGVFLRRADGTICPPVETFSGTDLAAVDFTNPEARDWFLSHLERLLDMGVAVFKTDFGEQAPADAVYHDGRSGVEMHNLYPLLYNQAVFELTERRFGRGLTWGRSGYAGSQRYPVQWGGDSYSTLDQMAGQIRALLSYGLSGVPFCSHDVGGFDYAPQAFDHETQEGYPKDPVVYARWLQFGVFSSHVRAHGKQPREPWTYGSQVEEIARRYLKLRYRLLPYIYSQAVKSSQTGLPMVRPLVVEYPDDPSTYHVDLQYLFGDDFLVAPVTDPAGRCKVYLPHGEWVDYWTKERVTGGRWLDLVASLDVLPLWVRAGAIVPMGPEMAYVGEQPYDPLTLELYYPQGEWQTTIYEEDAPAIPVRYRREDGALTVEVGAAPGEVEIVLYGVPVRAAEWEGQKLALVEAANGQSVRFDGTEPSRVVFYLLDE